MSADRKPFDWVAGVEAQMRKELLGSSDDALAALLDRCHFEGAKPGTTIGYGEMSPIQLSSWLRDNGVVVLPPDHGPKWDTFVDALGNALVDTDDAWAEVRGVTRELVESAARAALAVLRKDVT